MKAPPSDASIRKFFLWSQLPDALWMHLKQSLFWRTYGAGECLFSPEIPCDWLCVLWSGQAHVYAPSPDGTHTTLLRIMQGGAIFGVHTVFRSDMPPQSYIVADQACLVLCIPATVWEAILAQHPPTMAAYISFLTQRIEFLNRKIRYLTAGSAERRLALYLISEIPTDGVPTKLELSAISLAELLDLGRASLYRAFDRLVRDGYLLRNGRVYTLYHREQLLGAYS